jgi:hypothetical protein
VKCQVLRTSSFRENRQSLFCRVAKLTSGTHPVGCVLLFVS